MNIQNFNPVNHPKVFISYSWDSDEHRSRVLQLSDRLRKEGVDCNIDVYEASPSEGWPRWMINQLEWAEFVIVVCTEQYNRRFRGQEEPGIGRGVSWEGAIISQELYDASAKSTKFLPFVFSAEQREFIPVIIRGFTQYDMSTEKGYKDLYRRLTNQPLHSKPQLGKIVEFEQPVLLSSLPAREIKQDFVSEQDYLKQIHNQELLPNNPITKYFDNELAPILENIDFQICKGVFNKVFPDLELSPDSPIINIDDLKQLLVYEYSNKLSDGSLPIIKFAKYLANDNKLEEPIRHKFGDWFKKVIEELGLSDSHDFNVEIPDILNSYLLLLIKPQADNQFHINAYLIPNSEDKESVEPIDLDPLQKGISCPNNEIKAKVALLIKKSEDKLFSITNKTYELTIEFFWTMDYLHEEVEHWKLNDFSDEFLGEKYRVVVRSYERLQESNLILALRYGRSRLNIFREKFNTPVIDDMIEHLNDLDNLNWKKLKNRLDDKIGLRLTCSLPVSEEERKKLFRAILLSGIPIVMWIRTCSITNICLEDEIKKIWNVGSFLDFCTLFKILHKERKTAYENDESKNYLGYHLGVLCEDPNLEEFPDLKAAIKNLFT